MELNIIGAGLAGCEAAWQAANRGIKVNLFEMKKAGKFSDAHKSENFAELVCSNSFRNSDLSSAIGILQYELRSLNSLIMLSADHNQVPAGGALAVDRDGFSQFITDKIANHPNIKIIAEEVSSIIDDNNQWIIAAGPLCSEPLSQFIQKLTGQEHLSFFDAIAPVVYKDSINFDIAWYQSRYDKGDGKDYINCPMNKEQYDNFVNSIIEAEKIQFKDWEKNTPYFEGCLPIEVMASRGIETLRFGPMKPVGLTDPRNNERPYAVVQLRQDNLPATLYNIVGFQTKLKYGEQSHLFRQIPGLENTEFARLGGIHRNSFINSPTVLTKDLSLRNKDNIKFAGQITGVEGYIESTSIGLLAGLLASRKILGAPIILPPEESAIGSLLAHITINANKELFQPMNINFGLFPDPKVKNKKDKKAEISNRAIESIKKWKELIAD